MANISQATFSNEFSLMKIYKFRLSFHWSFFSRVQFKIFQHWFRQWLGVGQPTSNYLNQWWLIYWNTLKSVHWFLMAWRPTNNDVVSSHINVVLTENYSIGIRKFDKMKLSHPLFTRRNFLNIRSVNSVWKFSKLLNFENHLLMATLLRVWSYNVLNVSIPCMRGLLFTTKQY